MDTVRQPLSDFVARHPGLRLEDKGAALAVHFRQGPDLAERSWTLWPSLRPKAGLAVQHGKMVAELKEAASR